jgi:hypothetical protein
MQHRILLTVALIAVALAGCSRSDSPGPALPGAELGIEVLGIRLLAGGDLARLDFRVVDYDRARETFRGEIAVLPAGGTHALAVLNTGRLGPMRQRPSRSGKKQFVLFTNAGRALEPGATAEVVLGDARIPDVPVS